MSKVRMDANGWPVPPPCGTRAAYHRHRRRHETPCDACRSANNAYAARRRNTPERELQRLIAAQARDGDRVSSISLDRQLSDVGPTTFADLLADFDSPWAAA